MLSVKSQVTGWGSQSDFAAGASTPAIDVGMSAHPKNQLYLSCVDRWSNGRLVNASIAGDAALASGGSEPRLCENSGRPAKYAENTLYVRSLAIQRELLHRC